MAPHQTPTALQDEERSTGTSLDPSTSSHQLTLPMQQPESRTGNKPSRVDRSDRLCFFYGSLMDSGHIASVLDLAKEPDLRPARIHGYRTMQKGPFPALVRANNSAVSGMVYRMDGEADVKDQIAELSNYEGKDYGRHRVPIRFGDGSLEWGWTFIWIGDAKELREGAWDLEAWQRLWGRRNRVVSESPPIDRRKDNPTPRKAKGRQSSMTPTESQAVDKHSELRPVPFVPDLQPAVIQDQAQGPDLVSQVSETRRRTLPLVARASPTSHISHPKMQRGLS